MSDPDRSALARAIDEANDELRRVREAMAHRLRGQARMVTRLLTGLLAGGHVLLEGVPGLAKTRAVRTLAQTLDARFARVQFTPDLLPGDLTGTLVLDPNTGRLETRLGPIFAHLVLADEINRAPAKVQSALLEAMAEGQVTLGDQSHALPQPFFVCATQNPIEHDGTFRLAEAQSDRFMLHVRVDYPGRPAERDIMMMPVEEAAPTPPCWQPEHVRAMQRLCHRVHVAERVQDFILDIVRSTRPGQPGSRKALTKWLEIGASPRAAQSLRRAAQAHALIDGRQAVYPDDVKALAPDVLRHRLRLSYEAETDGINPDAVIADLLGSVVVP